MTDSNKDNEIKDKDMGHGVDSKFLNFVSLKTGKLAQAVYVVTNLVADSEPIKWRLRESVLDIVSDTDMLIPSNVIPGGLSQEGQISPLFRLSVLESVLNKILQINRLLEISLAAGFVSEMNLSLLLQEFDSLRVYIQQRLGNKVLAEITDAKEPLVLPAKNHGENFSDNLSNKNILSNKPAANTNSYVSNQKVSSSNRPLTSSANLHKDSRRSEILNFLKGKGWTSIKDISDAVHGCSTKTIQRELSDLVQKGLLKKKGDRRWSRYLIS